MKREEKMEKGERCGWEEGGEQKRKILVLQE